MIFGFFNTLTQNATKKFRKSEKFINWCKARKQEIKDGKATLRIINWIEDINLSGTCCHRAHEALIKLGQFPKLTEVLEAVKNLSGVRSFSVIKSKNSDILHLILTHKQQFQYPESWKDMSVGEDYYSQSLQVKSIPDLCRYREHNVYLPQEIWDAIVENMVSIQGRFFVEANLAVYNRCRGVQERMYDLVDMMGMCYLRAFVDCELVGGLGYKRTRVAENLGAWPNLGQVMDELRSCSSDFMIKPFSITTSNHPSISGAVVHMTAGVEEISQTCTKWMYTCRRCHTQTSGLTTVDPSKECPGCDRPMSFQMDAGYWDPENESIYLARVGSPEILMDVLDSEGGGNSATSPVVASFNVRLDGVKHTVLRVGPRSFHRNSNTLTLLLMNYVSDESWRQMMLAFHKCDHWSKHGMILAYPCSTIMPYLPGMCALHLIEDHKRLNMTRFRGTFWSHIRRNPSLYLKPGYHNLRAWSHGGMLHVTDDPNEENSGFNTYDMKNLVYQFCSMCQKSSPAMYCPNLRKSETCPHCSGGLLQLRTDSSIHHIAGCLSTSVDIDRLALRSGAPTSTAIDDPQVLLTSQQTKMEISLISSTKRLTRTSLDLGITEDRSNKNDYEYSYKYEITCQPINFMHQHIQKERIIVEKKEVPYDRFKAIRHDFVGALLHHDTDVSFKTLGINSPLTPDFIDKASGRVLELTTVASGNLKTMEDAYISKRISYEKICRDHDLTLMILVVSPTSVLTNMAIGIDHANLLSTRCRIALNIETELEQEFDISLYGEEESDRSNQVIQGQFEKFNQEVVLPEWIHFNRDLIRLQRSLTEEEELHVKKIMRETLRQCLKGDMHTPNKHALDQYLGSFTEDNSQKHDSQITIFPMVISKPREIGKRGNFKLIGANISTPEHLWSIAKLLDDKYELTFEQMDQHQRKIISIQMSEEVDSKFSLKKYNLVGDRKNVRHVNRETSKIYPTLTESEREMLALKGVEAKIMADDLAIKEKEARKKWSFHPDTPVQDIEKFWSDSEPMIDDEEWVSDIHNRRVHQFTKKMKERDELKLSAHVESTRLLEVIHEMKVSQLGELVTDICTEICMEYKVPTKPGEWLCKPLRQHKAIIFLKSTGTHTFFFLAYDKSLSASLETGSIGPELYESENYIISNISSITESYLEHFIKASSYIPMMAAHLISTYNVPILSNNWTIPEEVMQSLNYMVLTFLNNKTDHEEMLTNLRFLYMKLFQEVGSNTHDFVERLPTVLRSRLSVFSLSRIRAIIHHYNTTKIIRKKIETKSGIEWEYKNLRVIYHSGYVSFEQLIDSFYYSYVITKNKSAMGDHTFSIYNKVLKEQIKGHETITSKGLEPWGLLDKPLEHRWDWAVERKNLELCLNVMIDNHGPKVLDMISKDVYRNLSNLKFSDLSTLKASAKDYSEPIQTPDINKCQTRKEFLQEFKKSNKKLAERRPRVITRLVNLIDEYKDTMKVEHPTPIGLAIWAMKDLLKIGYVMCDLFIKDQHNGVREIHVLDIRARIIQAVAELICKTVNKYFENDTVSQPSTKKRFFLNHERDAEAELGPHITINKSADASKWCQRNHVSQFFYEVSFFTPKEFHPFLYCMYYLWTKKRIFLDPNMADNLMRNLNVTTTNPDYIRMLNAYHKGTNPFLEPGSWFMQTEFGMWQGICHCASCLKHNVCQTAWKRMTSEILMVNLGIKSTLTIVQGSDDSSGMVSIPAAESWLIIIIVSLLWWKEVYGKWSSIWVSIPKSSIGTVNMVEYNSEWWINGRNVRPTFRWNSAALETGVTERLPERAEQFYNSLSQSLENGAPILLCAVIQLLQAKLHYHLLGLTNHPLADEMCSELGRTRSVALGYFPLESDHLCGVTGFDYQLYLLARRGVEVNNWDLEMHNDKNIIEYDGKIDKILRESLRHYSIRFSNVSNYLEVVKKTGLPKLKDLLLKVEKNPEILYANYKTWEQEELKMSMILESSSVRASLSSHQPTARMMAASAYMISTPCVSSHTSTSGWQKRSLLSWSKMSKTALKLSNRVDVHKEDKIWFCNQDQYKEFTNFLENLDQAVSYQPVRLRRAHRVEVTVWGTRNSVDVPLLDLVKRKWFDLRTVHCGKNAFAELWKVACVRYPFLRDTYLETMKELDMEDISLYHLLQSISQKTRTVRLSDTNAKGTDLWNMMTRLFWPDTKVRVVTEASDVSIRELKNALHCLLSYFYRKDVTLEKAKFLLRANKCLGQDKSLLRDTHYRLKVFRDFLDGASKLSLIELIERSRQGVLGYFSKRQTTTPTGYTGSGEWVGLIDGIPTRISMFNKTVSWVKTQRLHDIESQCRSIKQLIKEFGLTFASDSTGSKSNLYLLEKGYLERSVKRPEASVPLIIDKSMHIDIRDHILKQNWFLDCEGNTLKLVFSESGTDKRVIKYTILSESYTAFHWDPLLPVPSYDDVNFGYWCRGAPCRPITLLNQMMFPTERSDVISLEKNMRDGTHRRSESMYDLRKFFHYFRPFMIRSLTGMSSKDYKLEMEGIDVEHTEKDLENLLSMDALGKIRENSYKFLTDLNDIGSTDLTDRTFLENNDISNIMYGSKAEEDDLDSLGDGDSEMGMYSDEEASDQSESFDEVREMLGSYDQVMSDSHKHWKEGYRGNLQQLDSFLSPFIDIIKDSPTSDTIISLLKKSQTLEGIDLFGVGGALMYVSTGKGNFINSEMSRALAGVDTSRTIDFMSESSAQGISTMDPVLLQEELIQINSILASLTGPLRLTMENRKSRIETELRYQELRDKYIDKVAPIESFPKMKFLTALYQEIEKREMWAKEDMHPNTSIMIEILVSNSLEYMSKCVQFGLVSSEELERARVSSGSSLLSVDLLKAICLYLSFSLKVEKDGEMIFEYSKALFKQEIIVELLGL